jgi:hypothetical protein
MHKGYRTRLHNSLRNTLNLLAKSAGLQSSLEHMPFSGADSQKRLDVFVQGAGDRGSMAVDMTYIQPFSAVSAKSALDAAAQTKKDKYQRKCEQLGISFHVGAVDFFGNMHPDLQAFVNNIARAMSRTSACEFTRAAAVCFGRLSVAIARCTGELFTHNMSQQAC